VTERPTFEQLKSRIQREIDDFGGKLPEPFSHNWSGHLAALRRMTAELAVAGELRSILDYAHGTARGFVEQELRGMLVEQSEEDRAARPFAEGGSQRVDDESRESACAWYDLTLRLVAIAGDDWRDWSRHSHEEKGFLLAKLGREAEAVEAFRAGMMVTAHMVDEDPSNTDWLKGSFFHFHPNKTVDRLAALGYPALAIGVFRAELGVYETMAADEHHWLDDLYGRRKELGDMLLAQGDRNGALEAYGIAIEVADRLGASNWESYWRPPFYANEFLWRDTLNLQIRIAELLVAGGNGKAALAALRAGLADAERLAASDRELVHVSRQQRRQLLLDILRKLAETAEATGDTILAQGFAVRIRDQIGAMRAD
jgi:tetratricopeptide (TPR) repeat protein